MNTSWGAPEWRDGVTRRGNRWLWRLYRCPTTTLRCVAGGLPALLPFFGGNLLTYGVVGGR